MHLLRGTTTSARPTTARGAATTALVAAASMGLTLALIDTLMRDHRPGLSAEPRGEGPGPKKP